jgi:hypothetical protein
MGPMWLPDIILALAGMATGIILGLPVVRALVRLVERKTGGEGAGDRALRAEVAELRARLEAVEEVRDRLVELEERLEFAERVLAQQRDRARLGEGS